MVNKKNTTKSATASHVRLIISIILFAGIVFNVGTAVLSQKARYTTFDFSKRFPALEKAYLNSQYISKTPTGWLPDEMVFSYAAAKYIQGINPVLVIPDAPPLGKYVIGLSILFFNNEHLPSLVFGIFSLIFLYLIGRQVFHYSITALLPPFFLTLEPLFVNQFIYTPLLDTIQLVYLLASLYFFNKALGSKRFILFFAMANLFLGFYIATKFFVTGIVVVAAWYSILILKKHYKKILPLTLTLPIAGITLLASYSRVFAFGYSLREILGIQKWVFLYHNEKLIHPFSIWPLLFLNQWHVWWGDVPILSDPQWRITWPIITILSLVTIVFYLLKKIERKVEIEVFMAWAVLYLLFFSLGNILARYFVILFPILYLISIYGLEQVYIQYKVSKKS